MYIVMQSPLNEDIEYFYFMLFCNQSLTPPISPVDWFDFCAYSLYFPECDITEIKQYVAFWVRLFSCNMLVLRFIHTVACYSLVPCYCLVVSHCKAVPRFVYPFTTDGHLGCFLVLAIKNTVAVTLALRYLCAHICI